MPIKDVYEVYSRADNRQLSNTELDALLLALSKEKERRANAEIEDAWFNLCNAMEHFIRLNGSLMNPGMSLSLLRIWKMFKVMNAILSSLASVTARTRMGRCI